MTRVQERFAALAEWFKASSASYRTPLGGTTDVGPYAVVIPQSLDLPPDLGALGPDHLPVWIPEAQVTSALPGIPSTVGPASQPTRLERLMHLIWVFEARRFEGAVIPLIEPNESLRSALDRNLPGLDLNEVPAIFLPVWDLDGESRTWVDFRLPLVR
jgi:hypothetical protein